MRKVFLTSLPYTSTAMCGQKVTGVSLNTVTVTAKGENLTGTAHVKGTATGAKGPVTCEGDVDFAYTTTTSSKKKGIGKKKKTTTTTTYWLSTVKLKAVQTPGVTFTPPPDEKPPEDDGDELAQSGSPWRRFAVSVGREHVPEDTPRRQTRRHDEPSSRELRPVRSWRTGRGVGGRPSGRPFFFVK